MLSAMDVSITTMMDAFEGLNRIGLLPMPFPYAQITKWCIVLYDMVRLPKNLAIVLKGDYLLSIFVLATSLFYVRIVTIGTC